MIKKIKIVILSIVFWSSILVFLLMALITFVGEIIGATGVVRVFHALNIPFSFFTPYITLLISPVIAIISHFFLKKLDGRSFF
jgi:hypothetical protein